MPIPLNKQPVTIVVSGATGPSGTAGIVVSDTPPDNPINGETRWMDSRAGNGIVSTYYDGVWVAETSGGSVSTGGAEVTTETVLDAIGDGDTVDSQYLPLQLPATFSGSENTLVTADIATYNRFTYEGAKDVNVPAASGGFVVPTGTVITIRNAADAGDITLAGIGGTVLKYSGINNIIPPHTTGQIYHKGSNVWDIQ